MTRGFPDPRVTMERAVILALLGEEADRDLQVSRQMNEVTRASEELKVTLDKQDQLVESGQMEKEVNLVYLEFRVPPALLGLKGRKEGRDAEGQWVYPVTWGSKEIRGQTDSKDLRVRMEEMDLDLRDP